MTAVPTDVRRSTPGSGRSNARVLRRSATSAPIANDNLTTSGAATLSPSAVGLGGALAGKPVRLVLAGRRVRLGSGAFVLMVMGTLSLVLVTLLYLNTSLAEDSFKLTKIRQSAKELTLQEQVLQAQLAATESTPGLEAKARALGMVPAPTGVFIKLSDGKVLGETIPAVAAPKAKAKKKKAVGGETPMVVAGPDTGNVASGGAMVLDPNTGAAKATPQDGSTGGETVIGPMATTP